jgi:hypothetical protein
MPADQFLPAIGHAVSGATGTAISTTATYPLDLVNTRLKVQGQLRKDGTISPSEQYAGITDAISRIYEREGGMRAFYAGLGSDVFKGVADSFLFFLFVSDCLHRCMKLQFCKRPCCWSALDPDSVHT